MQFGFVVLKIKDTKSARDFQSKKRLLFIFFNYQGTVAVLSVNSSKMGTYYDETVLQIVVRKYQVAQKKAAE